MLCFANVIFFDGRLMLRPSLTEVRETFTWWTLSVNREVTTWIFAGPP